MTERRDWLWLASSGADGSAPVLPRRPPTRPRVATPVRRRGDARLTLWPGIVVAGGLAMAVYAGVRLLEARDVADDDMVTSTLAGPSSQVPSAGRPRVVRRIPEQIDIASAASSPAAGSPAADPPANSSRPASSPANPSPADRSPAPPVSPAPPARNGVVEGIPDVLDTTTLSIGRTVVRLDGLVWARGGNAEELRAYISGRPASCTLVKGRETYVCKVAGQDLATVVAFNGGAMATPDAGPRIRSAEARARNEGLGVWKRTGP